MLLLLLQTVYVLCICYAVVSDLRDLIIPNWIVLTLLAAFVPFAAAYMEPRAVLVHAGVAVMVLLFFSAFFVLGWLAGGDVKFMAAIALWMGVEHSAPFMLLTAALGAVLALVLLQVKKYGFMVGGALSRTWLFQRMSSLAERSQCPYGVAIGTAALLSSGSLFQ